MKAEVRKVDEKTFKVFLGNHELGVTKSDFDARFHANAINYALNRMLGDLIADLDIEGMASLNNGNKTVRQFIQSRMVQNP